MPTDVWIDTIMDNDRVKSMAAGNDGVRFIDAFLRCGHKVMALADEGGAEDGHGTLGFSVLASILEGRIARHRCEYS